MSDEEDDDLQYLRSVALASIGKKKSARSIRETDDIDSLRRAALTSRNHHNNEEEDIFVKLQPAKSSNLINLTPDPNTEVDEVYVKRHSPSHQPEEESGSDSDDGSCRTSTKSSSPSKSSAEEDSLSDDGKSSDSDDSSAEEGESDKKRTDIKKDAESEEVDLLNVIDQFLDEGVMMLEDVITPVKTASSEVKSKVKKPKVKKVKKQKTKKIKKTEVKSKKPSRTARSNLKPKPHEEKPQHKKENLCRKEESTSKTDMQDHQESTRLTDSNFISDELPLQKRNVEDSKNKQNDDNDSVHSSDLSFLSDSSNSNLEVKKERKVCDREPGKIIQLKGNEMNRRRVDGFKRGNKRSFNTNAKMKRASDKQSSDDDQTVTAKANRPLPDLREKLKRRGLHRQVDAEASVEDKNPSQQRRSDNGKHVDVNRKNKIYIKPSVIYSHDNHADGRVTTERGQSGDAKSDMLIVTRNVNADSFAPSQVKLADKNQAESNSEPAKMSRRKRSVVPFEPNQSIEEKHKRLETIKKQVEEESSFSDLSETFDDYEIHEPDANTVYEAEDTGARKEGEKLPSRREDTRRFVASERSPLQRLASEDKHSKGRQSAKLEADSAFEAKDFPDENLKLTEDETRNVRSRLGKRKRAQIDSDNDQDGKKSRLLSSIASRINWSGSKERKSVKKRQLPKRSRDRKRRVDISVSRAISPDQDKALGGFSVKSRIGFQRTTSPVREKAKRGSSRSRERRKRADEDGDELVERLEHEKVVDARIRRINKQNAEILKRRQMIEMEEKKFRLKV